jgi:uncharacterized nucleotidyltransferase DUF6036
MNPIIPTAAKLQEFFQKRDWRFCIIGGVAVLRWGQVRATQDVDVTLLTGFGKEEPFIDELLAAYPLRPPCTREFALLNRVLLLTGWENTPMDVALGAGEFEERTIQRSSLWEVEDNLFLRTCSAEDLLVHKCFANRDKDWADVDGLLARQWNKLNLKLVRTELKPLAELKEEPGIMARLEQKITRHNQPFTRIKPTKPRKKRR